MLKITIPSQELYDEDNSIFVSTKETILTLEHSLVSLSKWESKWKKPFLTKEDKTRYETIDYIRMMTITQNVDDMVYNFIPQNIIDMVVRYIGDPMTATTFSNERTGGGRDIITAEIIYYWMITFSIPFECQKWHLNRLLALIKVCNIKNQKPKKMSKSSIINQQKALNAQRKAKLNTTG